MVQLIARIKAKSNKINSAVGIFFQQYYKTASLDHVLLFFV